MTDAPAIPPNRRLLVIDDNCAIHADFRKILGPAEGVDAELLADEQEIFGTSRAEPFEIDTAVQGEEGLRMVEQALADGRPYAVAFVDVRMPPGWDGVETTKRIWQACPDLQIVICTAYADCSWDEMQEQVQPGDRLVILKKPFDTIEVLQLANALSEKWRLVQESKLKLEDLEALVRLRTGELEKSQQSALAMMEEAVRHRQLAEQSCEDLQREMAERSRLEAQLLRSQRMECVGRLSSGVAHDLNNILTPILMATFMLRQPLSPEELELSLSTIETSTRRGSDLIKQLLTFGRGGGGKPEVVRPEAIFHDVIKMMESTFPKEITLDATVPRDCWPMMGDATQLHQLLLNLCVNARDAMPSGGTLTLRVQNVRLDENFASMAPHATPGPWLLLQVADTGEGIPPEIMDKIFDPFFTTKEVGKGTGLGLSTAIGIVEGHNGFLNVRSQVGIGTVFEIHLPAAPDAIGIESGNVATAPLAGRGELILVVEDEPGIREVTEKTLVGNGYRVVTAADGTDGVVAYCRHQDEIKVVVTDIVMPSMDGVTMTRILKRMDPGVKIVASSGIGSITVREQRQAELNALGVETFLAKPYSAEVILSALNRMLAPCEEGRRANGHAAALAGAAAGLQ